MQRKSLLGACVAALAVAFACAGSAPAQTGGTGTAASAPTDPAYYNVPFGYRDLRMGMNGSDVQTLNWVLRGRALGTPFDGAFAQMTDGAVRSVQSAAGIPSSGVVDLDTRKALAAGMRDQYASWYGPGFFGNRTACGKTLKKTTIGVAHKKLPCGTRVALAYNGQWARAKVIDRGPFIKGRKWDLTYATAMQLGTIPVGTAVVKATVAP